MAALRVLVPLVAVLMLNACGGSDKSPSVSDDQLEKDIQAVKEVSGDAPGEAGKTASQISRDVRIVEEVAGDTPEEMARKEQMKLETADQKRAEIEEDLEPPKR